MALRAVVIVAAAPSARVLGALLSVAMLGCSDHAIIGGLLCPAICSSNPSDPACPNTCVPDGSECGALGCPGDAAIDPCDGNVCAADAGSADAGCDAEPIPLTRKRLDLLVVIDEGVLIWWPYVVEGFDQFLQDPGSIGVGVGLQRFATFCETEAFVTPVVPIAPLPGNTMALQEAIFPDATGASSMVPALEGALMFAQSWAKANVDAEVAVLVVTDATPGACDALRGDYDQAAAAVVRAGLDGTPAIPTYVVGLGPLVTFDVLAQTGGAQVERLPDWPPPDRGIATALAKARDDARSCAFGWPSGNSLSAESAVVVKASDGSERTMALRRDPSGCGLGGFYVEDESAPYPLIACPQTCAELAGAGVAVSNACNAP